MPVYHPTFWRRRFSGDFIPALNHLIDALESRLLPNFQDSDISREADAAAKEAWERFMSMPATGEEDPADFAEAAEETGINYYVLVTGIKQGVINMFAAGLYHAYEQQLLYFHREELLPYAQQRDRTQLTILKVKELLSSRGIELSSFESWQLVEELRLVANTVKHAEGNSADQLRKCRPDLFEDPKLKMAELGSPFQSDRSIYLPMVGEDLFVQPSDLLKYKAALIRFWEELGESLFRLKEPGST